MEKVRIFKGHDIIDDMWDFYFLNRLYFGYWEHKHSRIIGTLGKRKKKKKKKNRNTQVGMELIGFSLQKCISD